MHNSQSGVGYWQNKNYLSATLSDLRTRISYLINGNWTTVHTFDWNQNDVVDMRQWTFGEWSEGIRVETSYVNQFPPYDAYYFLKTFEFIR